MSLRFVTETLQTKQGVCFISLEATASRLYRWMVDVWNWISILAAQAFYSTDFGSEQQTGYLRVLCLIPARGVSETLVLHNHGNRAGNQHQVRLLLWTGITLWTAFTRHRAASSVTMLHLMLRYKSERCCSLAIYLFLTLLCFKTFVLSLSEHLSSLP